MRALLLTIFRIVSFCRISAGKPAGVQNGLFANIMFRRENAIVSVGAARTARAWGGVFGRGPSTVVASQRVARMRAR
jgi:hypothetical protein